VVSGSNPRVCEKPYCGFLPLKFLPRDFSGFGGKRAGSRVLTWEREGE
jgi:hypothetical protein